jgi:hypothetical protein
MSGRLGPAWLTRRALKLRPQLRHPLLHFHERAALTLTGVRTLDVLGNGVELLALPDPEECPGMVDQDLIEHIVAWAVGLHASARAGELTEAMIARAGRR